MDRRTLKVPFVLERTPDWGCPTCEKGLLRFKNGTFIREERAYSRDHSHDAWDPNWIEYVYSGLLVCTNDKCGEVVSTSGTGTVDWGVGENENGIEEQVYSDHFRPTYFIPHLKIFKVPAKCPEPITDHLNRSFTLFFLDSQAAANSVRVAVEALLTSLGVKRFITVGGKRRYIALHGRIRLLTGKFSGLQDMLLAIKWLGNAGSHDGKADVSIDDVMDSYDLMEHILQEIYAPKVGNLKKLAKKVNKKKGPAK